MKNDKGPCKNKECGHSETKHYNKGDGSCIMKECPCTKYRN